jgi:hypothetical protein
MLDLVASILQEGSAMILIAGGLFLVMGLISGLLLALAPLGVTPFQPGLVAWILFPGLTILGYVFVLLASRTSLVPMVSRATGAALLLLAVIATVGLFLTANSMVRSDFSTLPLWYVLGVGLIFGTAGLSLPTGDKAQ